MTELVSIIEGEARADSFSIAEAVNNQHKNVLEMIRRNLADFEEFGGVAFQTRPFETAGGTQCREIALLNESQATLLMTYLRNNDVVRAFKKRLVHAFAALRNQNAVQIPNNLPDALRLAAEQAERAVKAEKALEVAEPKVVFFDQFCDADGLYNLQNAARALSAKPNLFIRWLKSKYLFYQGKALVPYVQYRHQGLFDVMNRIIDDKARPQTFITPKGLEYFSARLPNNVRIDKAS